MAVAIPIIIILVIAVVTTVVLAANRQRANTGLLSRETKQRDASSEPEAADASTSTELETTGRERADGARPPWSEGMRRRSERRRSRLLDGHRCAVEVPRVVGALRAAGRGERKCEPEDGGATTHRTESSPSRRPREARSTGSLR